MGQDRVIGRPAPGTAGFEKRGLEPTAVLVGPFEVERGRPLETVEFLEHEGVGSARIEPDIEDVGDLLEIFRVAIGTEEALGWAGEPGVRALGLDGIDDAVHHARIAQGLAGLFVDEHGDRHAPGALAGDAPVGPVLDHGFDALARLGRHPARLRDRLERSLPQAVLGHGDEPLRRRAEHQRRLGAPRMGVGMH